MSDVRLSEWDGLAVEERFIPSGEHEILVTIAGSGPALVLIHGIGSRGVSWVSVVNELAEEFQLVLIDLRGHGASSKPESGFLLSDYASDLDAVLHALGLDRPLIMGHSLGGMTALEWAIDHPNTAAALVIEDSPMNRGGEGVAELFDGWIELSEMTVEGAEAFYAEHNPDWDAGERHRKAVSITGVAPGVFRDMKADLIEQGGAVVTPNYAGIESPALLVYGDIFAGGMVPVQFADAFADTLKEGIAVHIPGGSHSLHRERPAEFLSIVLPFLRKHSDGASRLKLG